MSTIPEITEQIPISVTLSNCQVGVARIAAQGQLVKLVTIDIPGLVQIAVPLNDEVARQLATELTGGVLFPEGKDAT